MLSQGSIFGCCLKSVNHEQPVTKAVSTATKCQAASGDWRIDRNRRGRSAQKCLPLAAGLAFTTHLPRSVAAEDVHDFIGAIVRGLHPDAKIAGAEARVVPDGHRQAWDAGKAEHRIDRREAADQYHDLEAEDRVRDPRGDRFPANHDWPVVRDPHGDPVAERDTGEAEDEGEPPDGTGPARQHLLEFVTRRRCEDSDIAQATLLEVLERVDGRVDLVECTEHALHQRAPPLRGGSFMSGFAIPPCSICCERLAVCATRIFGGTTSLISEIASTGNCLMNSRNHMKNQPKLPSRIPMSTQVGA